MNVIACPGCRKLAVELEDARGELQAEAESRHAAEQRASVHEALGRELARRLARRHQHLANAEKFVLLVASALGPLRGRVRRWQRPLARMLDRIEAQRTELL